VNIIIVGPASMVVNGPQGYLCTIGASQLGTISCGATLGELNAAAYYQLPAQASIIMLSGTTAERKSVWPGPPAAIPKPVRGAAWNDTTLGAICVYEGTSSSGWSTTSSAGV
jgi:hypothetical protein